MTIQKKILMWFGLIISLPAAGYAVMGFIFYSWLNAAEPERWPTAKAVIWSFGSLSIAILFLILFVYCLVSIIKNSNKISKEEQSAMVIWL